MSNKLATIQKIQNISEHPNADKLELAKVLGWTVVVKKGEFKEGDLCLYIALDSILPAKPEFAFLENKQYRIRTQKLRGIVSMGICFPLQVAKKLMTEYFIEKQYAAKWDNDMLLSPEYFLEGTDVTEAIGVQKYEKPVPQHQDAKGNFPGFLMKTDEENIQNITDVVNIMSGKRIYVTKKHDGTSATYFVDEDGELHVCSRNLELKEGNNVYWNIADKYNLRDLPQGFVVQGEIVGPGIQGNIEGLKEVGFKVFNVACIASARGYMGYEGMFRFCHKFGLNMVDIVDEFTGVTFFWNSIDELLALADEIKYANGKQAEGIVVRGYEPISHESMSKPFSFKVKSGRFMLKHGE